ncbi:unnamed protein product [Calypogeia fissa]
MAFVMEFMENWIRRSMEDPEERDRKWREHVYSTKAKCEQVKEAWAQPVKPYGSWNSDKNNHKFLMDLKLGRVPGRTDPVEQAYIGSTSRSSS